MDCRTRFPTDDAHSPPAGPAERPRSAAPEIFFETARAAAKLCGVTRLADVTGLDRVGLPVWQAVRPAGRSLSVHQGRGASPLSARIGALCEAIEAHCAERTPADGPLCAFNELPPHRRAPEIGDYCDLREDAPGVDERLAWCLARDFTTGETHYLPHPLVSLDYRTGLPSLFDRTSGGIGAGASEEDALRTAILEVIERDAMGEWDRLTEAARIDTRLDLDSIPFDWFSGWRERLASLGIDLQVFRIETLAGVAVFRCLIGAVEEFGPAYRRFYGMAADGEAEVALFKALAEALQSRLTLIAGVRDDFLPDYYARRVDRRRPAGGVPNGARMWAEEEPLPAKVECLAQRLAGHGYPNLIYKRLDEGISGVAVVRAFVPGLGSVSRTRRPGR